MFKTLRNAWNIPDLRKKIIFTMVILLVYRFGAVLPVPFIDADKITNLSTSFSGSLFGYMNILSGGALTQGTLFALGVSPYITASIVIQLLGVAFPKLGEKGQTEEGKRFLNNLTRIVTVVLAIVTAIGYFLFLEDNYLRTDFNRWFMAIVIVICFTAGAAIVMWLGELIDAKGIGNGISMILFANILAGSTNLVLGCWDMFTNGTVHFGWKIYIGAVLLLAIASIFFVVFVTNSERRLPVEYAKRVSGRKMYGGQRTTLPIKLNMSGVMPIIFANAIVALPQTFQMIFSARLEKKPDDYFWNKFFNFFSYESWFYAVMFFILIIAFAYFYISISFNPVEVSNNLQKNGGFIKGFRPGKPTADHIKKVLNRVTLMGAIFLAIIAVVPLIANIVVLFVAGKIGSNVGSYASQLTSLAFGVSSLLIVVGVILETAREIEAQMSMRHYKGFLE